MVIDGLKLTSVNINKAVPKVENTRKPMIILVEVENIDIKKATLKAKPVLRKSNKFRDV